MPRRRPPPPPLPIMTWTARRTNPLGAELAAHNGRPLLRPTPAAPALHVHVRPSVRATSRSSLGEFAFRPRRRRAEPPTGRRRHFPRPPLGHLPAPPEPPPPILMNCRARRALAAGPGEPLGVVGQPSKKSPADGTCRLEPTTSATFIRLNDSIRAPPGLHQQSIHLEARPKFRPKSERALGRKSIRFRHSSSERHFHHKRRPLVATASTARRLDNGGKFMSPKGATGQSSCLVRNKCLAAESLGDLTGPTNGTSHRRDNCGRGKVSAQSISSGGLSWLWRTVIDGQAKLESQRESAAAHSEPIRLRRLLIEVNFQPDAFQDDPSPEDPPPVRSATLPSHLSGSLGNN